MVVIDDNDGYLRVLATVMHVRIHQLIASRSFDDLLAAILLAPDIAMAPSVLAFMLSRAVLPSTGDAILVIESSEAAFTRRRRSGCGSLPRRASHRTRSEPTDSAFHPMRAGRSLPGATGER